MIHIIIPCTEVRNSFCPCIKSFPSGNRISVSYLCSSFTPLMIYSFRLLHCKVSHLVKPMEYRFQIVTISCLQWVVLCALGLQIAFSASFMTVLQFTYSPFFSLLFSSCAVFSWFPLKYYLKSQHQVWCYYTINFTLVNTCKTIFFSWINNFWF